MPLRARYGKWHIRFWVNGRPFCQPTDLVATERNKTAALRIEVEVRKMVLEGRAHELRLEIIRFNEASDKFLKWADGEHREHPKTGGRLRTSFASLRKFFGSKPVPSIIEGPINDYMAWRRTEHEVKEITLRHDLHALSKFFGYAMGHNWARRNPVRGVDVPSDADAVRMYILNREEEIKYFQAARSQFTIIDKKGIVHTHGPFPELHDVGRVILLQGCRPEEVYNLLRTDVNLEKENFGFARGSLALRDASSSYYPKPEKSLQAVCLRQEINGCSLRQRDRVSLLRNCRALTKKFLRRRAYPLCSMIYGILLPPVRPNAECRYHYSRKFWGMETCDQSRSTCILLSLRSMTPCCDTAKRQQQHRRTPRSHKRQRG